MGFFSYTRTKQVAKKDENGKIIFKKDEEGKELKDQPETEEKKFTDWFNLGCVIRTFTIEDDHVIVLLNDGHEQTDKIPVLKNKLKPPTPNNVVEEKQRNYVQSEISVRGEDIARLHEALAKA